jgi:hypothetical protein
VGWVEGRTNAKNWVIPHTPYFYMVTLIRNDGEKKKRGYNAPLKVPSPGYSKLLGLY